MTFTCSLALSLALSPPPCPSPPPLCGADTGNTSTAVASTVTGATDNCSLNSRRGGGEQSLRSLPFSSLQQVRKATPSDGEGAGCSRTSALLQEPGTGHGSCHEHTHQQGGFQLARGVAPSALLGGAGKEGARAAAG